MTKEDFSKNLNQLLSFHQISDQKLATQIPVSITTVRRWKEGKSHPHPVVQNVVFEAIEKILEDKNG